MSSAAIVVTAKLAAWRSVPRPPGVPVTTISSSGSPSGVVGASWAAAGSDMSAASPKTPWPPRLIARKQDSRTGCRFMGPSFGGVVPAPPGRLIRRPPMRTSYRAQPFIELVVVYLVYAPERVGQGSANADRHAPRGRNSRCGMRRDGRGADGAAFLVTRRAGAQRVLSTGARRGAPRPHLGGDAAAGDRLPRGQQRRRHVVR